MGCLRLKSEVISLRAICCEGGNLNCRLSIESCNKRLFVFTSGAIDSARCCLLMYNLYWIFKSSSKASLFLDVRMSFLLCGKWISLYDSGSGIREYLLVMSLGSLSSVPEIISEALTKLNIM